MNLCHYEQITVVSKYNFSCSVCFRKEGNTYISGEKENVRSKCEIILERKEQLVELSQKKGRGNKMSQLDPF